MVLGPDLVRDPAYYESARRGIARAASLPGVHTLPVSDCASAAALAPAIERCLSRGAGQVIAAGASADAAVKQAVTRLALSRRSPAQFAVLGGPGPYQKSCEGLVFHDEQGAFLAGYLAASLSHTHRIGYLAGQWISLTERMESGFRTGARTADASCRVTTTFAGTWRDATKIRACAAKQIASGIDVIFGVAGRASAGVREAARARPRRCCVIGWDAAPEDTPDSPVVASDVTHAGAAVVDTIRRMARGDFPLGQHAYGIKEGGVELVFARHPPRDVPAAVKLRLHRLAGMIESGALMVPTYLDNLGDFQPPRLP